MWGAVPAAPAGMTATRSKRGVGRNRWKTARDNPTTQAFWREHGQPLLGAASYHEIAPHLVLVAFLPRVVNGGGSLEREYAVGKGRILA